MAKLTTEELSLLINGSKSEDRFTKYVIKMAKDNNLVIVYTIGDDTVMFCGAVTDEFDMLHGGKIFLAIEDGECIPYTKNNASKTRKVIEVFWENHSFYKWKFLTLIKHSCYDLKKDNKNFCKGIVFSLDSI